MHTNDSNSSATRLRRLPVLLAAGALSFSLMAISAPAAEAAGNVSVGYKSCVQGSVRSAVNATGSQTHTLYKNGIKRSKSFPYSGRYVTQKYYPGLNPVTGGHLYSSGGMSWGNIACAD